jgi:hypothetical protein
VADYIIDLNAIIIGLFLIGFLTWIDLSLGFRDLQNLAVIFLIVFLIGIVGFMVWRGGRIVAEARFDPGIAPFDITVRKVPVPVTASQHFIITLSRGQYRVTSFRYFWVGYTPKNIKIDWTRLETLK